jgi:hypothetical protein
MDLKPKRLPLKHKEYLYGIEFVPQILLYSDYFTYFCIEIIKTTNN